jgi:hypothetical protein
VYSRLPNLWFVEEAEFDGVVDPVKIVHPYVAKAS